MKNSVLVVLALVIVSPVFGRGVMAAPTAGFRQAEEGFIAPKDVNVYIEPDPRMLVVMAAINIAGFDYEAEGRPLAGARGELRSDLAGLDPAVKQRLADFYKSHRRAGTDEAADAFRYEALSLLMTPPPSFSIYVRPETIPDDLRPLVDFVPLVEEFYRKSGMDRLLEKYMKMGEVQAAAVRMPIGGDIYSVLNYFHSQPDTIVELKPLVIDAEGATRQEIVTRTRTRYLFVLPDPFAPADASWVRDDFLNQKDDLANRKVGDDYIVGIGSSGMGAAPVVRKALVRFAIDAVLERHLKAALQYKAQLVKLVASVPTAQKRYAASVYLIVRDSLAAAAEARLERLESDRVKGAYSEDEAVFDLSQAYSNGAVLSFHFYEALAGWEKVGIGIEEFMDRMVADTPFDQEAGRLSAYRDRIAKVGEARARRREEAPSRSALSAAAGALPPDIADKVLTSDELIRQHKFADAKIILSQVLAGHPDNARALYGMAEVYDQLPSTEEADPKANEDDKIQAQYNRLKQALALFRRAAEHASPDSERWLIQWSYVFEGRILDFQDFRQDAIAAYEKAIELGECPNGAYKEALAGKQRPYGQQ